MNFSAEDTQSLLTSTTSIVQAQQHSTATGHAVNTLQNADYHVDLFRIHSEKVQAARLDKLLNSIAHELNKAIADNRYSVRVSCREQDYPALKIALTSKGFKFDTDVEKDYDHSCYDSYFVIVTLPV
jgi:hypothetical protein